MSASHNCFASVLSGRIEILIQGTCLYIVVSVGAIQHGVCPAAISAEPAVEIDGVFRSVVVIPNGLPCGCVDPFIPGVILEP